MSSATSAAEIPISCSPLLPSTPSPHPFPRPVYYEITILTLDNTNDNWSPTKVNGAFSPNHSSSPSATSSLSPPPSLLKRLKPTLDHIKFRNHFVGSVTIQQLQKRKHIPQLPASSPPLTSPTSPTVTTITDHWQTILQSRPLMSSVHSERDASLYHIIPISEFSPSHYEPASDAPIRIYLEQPSPLWQSYSLSSITFVGSVHGSRRRSSVTRTGSSSAWPPVGSAGASLIRNFSKLNNNYRNGGNNDLWANNNALGSPSLTNAVKSNLPGAKLDMLSRAISQEMSMIRSTDILQRSQASAFFDVDREVYREQLDNGATERTTETQQKDRRYNGSRRAGNQGGWR